MQLASNAFDEAIRKPIRNRGYIKVTIGVINSDAQNNAEVIEGELSYFSDAKKPFNGYNVTRVYATAEEGFSKLDGSMYFLPAQGSGLAYYNNGIVAKNILGSIKIGFGDRVSLDIKGLTINFGEYYPTKFTVETDFGAKVYANSKSLFTTEDSFDGVSYFTITPLEMVNGRGRLRINEFLCGIANTFSNEKVKSCRTSEYVSPISDTIPSMDTTVVIDNQDLYYSVDNPESTIAYMEVGQEVKVSFGFDVTGDGEIEWLADTTTYLGSWKANDAEAEFSSTDRFYQLDENYYGGKYREDGISLYDLALEVLNSAGITDSREYAIDSYLKKIIVYNPLPVMKHNEALQVIANAGRCVLYEDRTNRIHMKSSFVPDMTAESDDQAEYSRIEKILKSAEKSAYAVASNDFSVLDGSILFIPRSAENYLEDVGYASASIADDDGNFENPPVICIDLESGFVAYGLEIKFRNVAPQQFEITTFYEGEAVQRLSVDNPDKNYITDERFDTFDRMELTFTRGYPNSRVFVDNILVGDVTNYTIRTNDLVSAPTGERQQKVKSIVLAKTNYRQSEEGLRELLSEEVTVSDLAENKEHIVYFSIASYGFGAQVKDNDKVSVEILESSNFFARLRFSGITDETTLNLVVEGYEYVSEESYYRKQHNVNGQEISWSNPLISTNEQAMGLEEWLASYYLGDVDYEISWRGDPRVEANDLFYLELRNRDTALIRSYVNEMEFNGSWSGNMKARRVVMKWQ